MGCAKAMKDEKRYVSVGKRMKRRERGGDGDENEREISTQLCTTLFPNFQATLLV